MSPRTHRDLVPEDLCPLLVFKHRLVDALDQAVEDDRAWPGDGYYWCQETCCEIGPDDEIAHPATCRPGRPCHAAPKA